MDTKLFNHNEVDLFEESVIPQIIFTDKPFIVANTIKSIGDNQVKIRHYNLYQG